MPVNSVVDEVVLTKDAAPELTVPDDAEITVGDEFDALAGVSASDNVDGDLTDEISVDGAVDTATAGSYTLTYTVSDARGNETVATRTVTVVADTEEPGTEEPGTEEPGTEEPGTEEPGAEEPETEEPGTEEPGIDGRPGFVPAAPTVDGDDLPLVFRDVITVSVAGRDVTIGGLAADEWHFGYVYSEPQPLGWTLADADGSATLTLPAGLDAGEHRLAMLDADGELVGWAEFTVADLPVTGG